MIVVRRDPHDHYSVKEPKSMRSRITVFIAICLMFLALADPFSCSAGSYDEAREAIQAITGLKMRECGASDVQEWIEKDLVPNAGLTAETYAYALAREGGYDLTGYTDALKAYLEGNVVRAATTRLKYALCLTVADRDAAYIQSTVDEAVGAQGIMSLVYGLHLYNNGYVNADYPAERIINEIIDLEKEDGGWAVMGERSDVDVTAMVLQAFAGYLYTDKKGSSEAVSEATGKALQFLSDKQNPNGGYSGFGSENAESTAQVLIAASSLGIDCSRDERFIKNGNTVFDGLRLYRLADGTYSHVQGGESSSSATTQFFTAMEAYVCMKDGKGPYYYLERTGGRSENPVVTDAPVVTTEPGGINASDDTGEHGSDDAPETTRTPAAADSTNLTDTPDITEAPVSTGVPDVTDAPAATGVADVNDTPAATDAPEVTDAPVDTESTDNTELTDSPETTAIPEASSGRISYKPIACLIILALLALVCGLMYLLKKRNYKNYAFAVLLAIAAIAVVLGTDIQSRESYYSSIDAGGRAAVGTVTFEIRCDTIVGEASEYIPADGTILKKTEMKLYGDETVYDLLIRAVRENGIHMETQNNVAGAHGASYINGIGHIYEYEYGELSGWLYYVNGVAPSVGCGEYRPADNDEIVWRYTREIGRDIE